MEAEHTVAGGVVSTVRDAVPFHYRMHSWVTGRAAARRLGMEGRDSSRVHCLNLPNSNRQIEKKKQRFQLDILEILSSSKVLMYLAD